MGGAGRSGAGRKTQEYLPAPGKTAARAEKTRKICPHNGFSTVRAEKCPDFCPRNGFSAGQAGKCPKFCPHTWIFLPGRSGVGEEVAAVLRDEGAERRRGGVAEWRKGEKERRGEGEKERSAKDLGFTTGKCHGGRSVGVCCKLTGVEGGVFYSKPPPKGFQGWSLKI